MTTPSMTPGRTTAFAAAGPTDVKVEIQMGRLDVIAGPRDDVTVTVVPTNADRSGDRNASEKVRAQLVGDRVVISGPFRPAFIGPGDSIDVVVEVPEGSSVEAANKYGAIHLVGRFGAVRANLGSGEISLDVAERLDVKGGHGDLRVDSVTGDAQVELKSGATRIGRVGGSLRVNGSDGSVSADEIVGRAEVDTSSGGVELGTLGGDATLRSAYGGVRIREARRGVLRVDGSHGNVDVGVRSGTAVWLDASSRRGVVRTDLASDTGPSDDEDRLEIHIRTGYGSITVQRAAPAAG